MSENTWFAGSIRRGWQPKDGGLNELFSVQVRSLRERCALSKVKIGVEEGRSWILYEDLPHARCSVFVKVTRLSWLEFDRYGGAYDGYLSPVFRLQFEMAEAIPPNRLRGGGRDYARGKTFYQDEFEIMFPSDYPSTPPNFRLGGVRGFGPSHEHHLNQGDWLCIIAGARDWNGRSDNVASGLGPAFDWAAWHHLGFGDTSGNRRGWLPWNH